VVKKMARSIDILTFDLMNSNIPGPQYMSRRRRVPGKNGTRYIQDGFYGLPGTIRTVVGVTDAAAAATEILAQEALGDKTVTVVDEHGNSHTNTKIINVNAKAKKIGTSTLGEGITYLVETQWNVMEGP
jgi:hypothetical protein